MFRLFVTASFLLVSVNAVAGENAFNADMDNPTISAAISEFEKVCFPFISHETELTPEQDRAVFQSRMVEAGYEFGEEKTWRGITPTGIYYPLCPQGSLPMAVPPRVEGKFTVFPASGGNKDIAAKKGKQFTYFEDQIVQSSETIIGQTCEVVRAREVIRHSHYTQQRYEKRNKLMSAYLTWQKVPDITDQIIEASNNPFSHNFNKSFKIRTSFPPASSCTIHAKDKTLTADIIEGAIIAHDSDWKRRDVKRPIIKEIISDAYSWSQCAKQDEENYVYKASLIDGSFSLSVEALQDYEYVSEYGCEAPEAG